jgi:RNA polymerase sigma-70 factor, ECF subfamily
MTGRLSDGGRSRAQDLSQLVGTFLDKSGDSDCLWCVRRLTLFSWNPWRRDRFDRLLAPAFDDLYRFACRLTGNRAAADDLLQDALVTGIRKFGQLKEARGFRVWMSRIVHRTWLNRRRDRPAAWRAEHVDREQGRRGGRTPVACLEDRRLAVHLQDALTGLPEGQRHAVWLVDALGFTFGEAAVVLDVPPGTVASRVARGRAALRDALSGVAHDWGCHR